MSEEKRQDYAIKNIIKYGLLVLIPLLIGGLSLVFYGFYIDVMNKIQNAGQQPNQNTYKDHLQNTKRIKPSQRTIQRLGFLKYTHESQQLSNSALYLIEMVRIGHCKYIILSKKNCDPMIIHAYDCDYQKHPQNKIVQDDKK